MIRLSRRALILLGSVSAAIIGGAAIWALGVHHGGAPAPQELYSTDRKPIAEGLNGLPRDYGAIPKPAVPQLGPPLPGDLGRPILRSQQENGTAPVPVPTGPSAEEQARIAERQRLAQERDAALRGQVFFQVRGRQPPAAALGGGTDVAAVSQPVESAPIPSNQLHHR